MYISKTLGANENGMTLTITAPLATVLHNWTAAQIIDITQSSRIGEDASPAWNVRGRLMAGDYDVNINDSVTNVFGVISKINILNTMNATANNNTNDIQALVGVVNINATSGTTLQSESTSTICGVKGIISRSQTGTITLDHNVYAGVFSYNMDGSTVSGASGILDLYNYGSDTCDTGINIHPHGTLTTGISLIPETTGAITTAINIGACTNAFVFPAAETAPSGANIAEKTTLDFTNWVPIKVLIGSTAYYMVAAQTIGATAN